MPEKPVHYSFGILITLCVLLQELEPFPKLDIFHDIRMFHEELCQNYSPTEHLLSVSSTWNLNEQFDDLFFLVKQILFM